VLADTTPVDAALALGDVVLWHHRMVHTGGGWQNLSRCVLIIIGSIIYLNFL
jgi:hypothetical protein